MIATQTWAVLVDAYRELNAKKLFWITMGLSVLVVAAFAMIGINEKGMTILWWTMEIEAFNSSIMDPADFYKLTFTSLGVGIWLTWVATILALVSTASMIPDMLASGSIELVLARPISRTRLFLTKYIAGLLFVFLQVLVFSVASFLVIGIRGGVWEPGLFLAVPVVTLFFSYLFGLCTLFGVVTRSAIAALLMTLLVWFLTFALNTTEIVLLTEKTRAEMSADRHALVLEDTRPKVVALEEELADLESQVAAGALAEDDAAIRKLRSRIKAGSAYIARIETDAPKHASSAKTIAKWHRMIFGVKTALPKTAETTELLNRWLVDAANLPSGPAERPTEDKDFAEFLGASAGTAEGGESDAAPKRPQSVRVSQAEVQRTLQDVIRSRSVAWVVGTSLIFEAICVGLAAFLFKRRDF